LAHWSRGILREEEIGTDYPAFALTLDRSQFPRHLDILLRTRKPFVC